MLASGGLKEQVTKKGGSVAFESADGKFLYYLRMPSGPLWKMPVEGGEETQVLDLVLQKGFEVTEDGIYYLNEGPQGLSLQFLALASGRSKVLANLPFTGYGLQSGLAVSPDRKSILYSIIDQTGSDLMLVENFR